MNGWDFDDLHQIVRVSVRANAHAPIACGCKEGNHAWTLCMYHEGMQRAAELLTLDIEEREGLILALAGTVNREHLTVDEADLFDRIVAQ